MMTAGRATCVICSRERSAVRCEGCLNMFCFDHLGDHRAALNKQLDEIAGNRDTFRQTFIEQTSDPQKHVLMEQINRWERESIKKIQQTSEEAREILMKQIINRNARIEFKINTLTDQLKKTRQENDVNETDLTRFQKTLSRLTNELNKPLNVFIREDPISFIAKIYVDIPAPLRSTKISASANWIQNGIVVAGKNETNQLNGPYGICVDDDQTVYIADWSNHCIFEWKRGAKNGLVVAGGNGRGRDNDQLNQPTDVIVDKENDCLIICDLSNRRVVKWSRQSNIGGEIIISDIDCWGLAMDDEGSLYISDCTKHEVRRWRSGDKNGIVVAGGNGQDNRLDQLDSPTYIFVDNDHTVYVSDTNNHRVMKWMKETTEGIVVAGGQGQGNDLTQLSCPHGVIVDQSGTIYVADSFNQRIVCWSNGATCGRIVINGILLDGINPLEDPIGLSFDRPGNLYVSDFSNHRIQQFNIDLSLHS